MFSSTTYQLVSISRKYFIKEFDKYNSNILIYCIIVKRIYHPIKFRYGMVRVTENTLDPTEHGRGLFNYLWDGVKLSRYDYLHVQSELIPHIF